MRLRNNLSPPLDVSAPAGALEEVEASSQLLTCGGILTQLAEPACDSGANLMKSPQGAARHLPSRLMGCTAAFTCCKPRETRLDWTRPAVAVIDGGGHEIREVEPSQSKPAFSCASETADTSCCVHSSSGCNVFMVPTPVGA